MRIAFWYPLRNERRQQKAILYFYALKGMVRTQYGKEKGKPICRSLREIKS
jgi:hypothetical protein